jgi:hypothetical protein
MSQTSHIEEIRADLACPQCQYNLRGLQGELVACPECGTRCDVAQLIARQWQKPWYHAPGFNRLAIPAAWFYLAGIGSLSVLLFQIDISSEPPVFLKLGLAAAVFGGFVLLLEWNRRWWGGLEGALLSMIPVPIVFGFLVGGFGLLTCVLRMFSGDVATVFWSVVLFTVFLAMVFFCREGEKFIARRCIRRYLANAASRDLG